MKQNKFINLIFFSKLKTDNFQVLSWREKAIRGLIVEIAELFSKLLLQAYKVEIREIDRLRREPGFAHRRLNTSLDEIDLINNEEEQEEEDDE